MTNDDLVLVSPGGMVHAHDPNLPGFTRCGRTVPTHNGRWTISPWQPLCAMCFPGRCLDQTVNLETSDWLCSCDGSMSLMRCPTCGKWRIGALHQVVVTDEGIKEVGNTVY